MVKAATTGRGEPIVVGLRGASIRTVTPRYDSAWTNSTQNHVGSSGSAVNPATAGNRRRPDGRQRSASMRLATRI